MQWAEQQQTSRHWNRSLEFPTVVWPFNRCETGIEYSGVGALGVGMFGNMLPTVSSDGRLNWMAAAEAGGYRESRRFYGREVVLKKATRVPGLLDPDKSLAPSTAAEQFERMYGDLDISRDLLCNLFDESNKKLDDELQGNALAMFRSKASDRDWVLHADGDTGSELWARSLYADEASVSARAMEFTTAIRQIETHAVHTGLACVRTDSMVGLAKIDERHLSLSARIVGNAYDYGSVGGDQWTCHAAWSPWMASEFALASITGAVRLWDCATREETSVLSAVSSRRQWSMCAYWDSPRVLLHANTTLLSSIDVRAKHSQCEFLNLKQSPFARPDEVLTAAAISALHPMHAIVASTHMLRVFDRRYPRQPLLAWALTNITDPLVRLDSAMAGDHCVVAAATKSARVSIFEYSQPGADSPFVSHAQSMPRQPSGSVHSMMDALSVDLSANAADVRILLDGLTLHVQENSEVLCITHNTLGGISAVPLRCSKSSATLNVSPDPQDMRSYRREEAWGHLRSQGVPFERIDLRKVYQYLVCGALRSEPVISEPTSTPTAVLSDKVPAVQDVAASLTDGISAHAAAVLVASTLGPFKQRLDTELPSWTAAGQHVRDELVLRPLSSTDNAVQLIESLRNKSYMPTESSVLSSLDPLDVTSREDLEQIFSTDYSCRSSLDRAAIDMALSEKRICNDSMESSDDLGAMLGNLPEHAQLLSEIWEDDSHQFEALLGNESQATHQPEVRRRKSRPPSTVASSLTQPPALGWGVSSQSQNQSWSQPVANFFSQPIPGVASISSQVHIPPVSSNISIPFGSSERQTQNSQPIKKKKPRKSGF
ncbi:hypothetical protein LPJ73_000340 [Coemansia sp. RSA 2703]|nr:hypothetical protein LPJ73_000340 [Coemansia sp. RSA 2703]KAJ2377880.1 hypothetical protein IW150_001125 [Coemansia sp. RSA 2607]KAJ2398110.1 hypothetical protein GGI05_000290 [Coemansia sp. RSA 2603]